MFSRKPSIDIVGVDMIWLEANSDVELLTFQHQTFRTVLSPKSTEQITIQMRNWIACYSNFKSFNDGIELQVFKL